MKVFSYKREENVRKTYKLSNGKISVLSLATGRCAVLDTNAVVKCIKFDNNIILMIIWFNKALEDGLHAEECELNR